MALQGTLKDFGIADILQLIGQQQKTGVLHLKSREQEINIGFKDGSIVKAESTTRKKKDLIGNMLVRAEIISETQLQLALETQQRTLRRLGDVLVSMRMIDAKRFKQMVQLQTSETLYKLFSWKAGTYAFEQGDVEYDAEVITPLRAESVLMEGFRMVDEWPVIKKTITSYQMSFDKLKELPPPVVAAPASDDFDEALEGLGGGGHESGSEFRTLGEGERKVFGLIAPHRDVMKLIDLSWLGEFETCKSLLNLVNRGYLKSIQARGDSEEVGAGPAVAGVGRALGVLARVAVTMLVLASLAWVGSRMDLDAFTLSSSPASSFADPAAQRFIARAQLSRIQGALDVYRLERGGLPDRLDVLVEAGLLGREDLHYPWREDYYYRRGKPGGSEGDFVLLSPLR
jgi:hypothetical protein